MHLFQPQMNSKVTPHYRLQGRTSRSCLNSNTRHMCIIEYPRLRIKVELSGLCSIWMCECLSQKGTNKMKFDMVFFTNNKYFKNLLDIGYGDSYYKHEDFRLNRFF